jgi:acyl-coenzyme A thioesterase 13
MNKRVEFFLSQIGKEKWAYDYPLMDWLKASVLNAAEQEVRMQFKVEQYMLNPTGILHGGIAATMLDELMGAATSLAGRPTAFATINMSVDYLHSARLGDIITGEGRIIRAGKTVMHAEARLMCGDKVLAKATSNLIATSFRINF